MTEQQANPAAPDLEALLVALPPEIAERLRALPPERDLIEVVMDLGRPPEARFGAGGEEVLLEREVSEEDIQYVIDHIGSFGDDNRAGIERTLHRISRDPQPERRDRRPDLRASAAPSSAPSRSSRTWSSRVRAC